MASFKYHQKIKRRIIRDTTLKTFPLELFNFDTQYVEPFQHTDLSSMAQSFVPRTELRPQRIFNLELKGLKIYDEGIARNPNMDFMLLYDFYLEHGTYKHFILKHPVYGDVIVRFGKTISIPKKIQGGFGAIEAINILLVEKITTAYNFSENEDFVGILPMHFGFFDVEIDTQEDTLVAPLGNNYEMIFIRAKKPLRKLKISIQGLKYYWYDADTFNLSSSPQTNLALLEIFYLKHRLNKTFMFNYLGEDIPVRFSEPLVIPKIESQTGVILNLDIVLIETPNEPFDGLVKEPESDNETIVEN